MQWPARILVVLASLFCLTVELLAHPDSYSTVLAKARKGDQRAALAAAIMLLEGKDGAPADTRAAGEWFRLCADAGDPVAQTQLGYMHIKGIGMARDPKGALRWFLRAATSGYAPAQFNLSLMYFKGKGVAPDFKQGLRWLIRAAEGGRPEAQMNLALLYAEGHPELPRNPVLALHWMREAANRKFLCAEYNLGVLYLNGIGTGPDPNEARHWFDHANSHRDISGRSIDAFQYCVGPISSEQQFASEVP